jgi:hypothetical protein
MTSGVVAGEEGRLVLTEKVVVAVMETVLKQPIKGGRQQQNHHQQEEEEEEE